MELREYAAADATELRHLIRSGSVSVGEVWRAAATAIETVNTSLNAVVGPLFENPLDYDIRGPFAGVPFAVKDLLLTAQGVPSQSGSALTRDFVASADSDLMSRWRRAGLATVCRTSTPEFGLSCTTEPVVSGPTRNPWDPTRTAGGSSGGSAALVASGAVPWAHANDAAGSIRIPSALCGLVGLKPTRGRTPVGPDADEPLFGLTSEFAITRTVRDAAALLDEVHGGIPGDRYLVARPPGRYSDALINARRPLRIAVSTESPFGTAVDPRVVEQVLATAQVLEHLGHHVDFAQPTVDGSLLLELNIRFFSASIGRTIQEISGSDDVEASLARVEASTAACARRGLDLRWTDVAEARSWQNDITRSTAGFFADEYDVLMTPTVATPAWSVGSMRGNQPGWSAESWIREIFEHVPFTVLFNVTGQPAISVPIGMVDGLPVGGQFAAAQGAEHTLLALASELEQAAPWAGRVPPVHVAADTIDPSGAIAGLGGSVPEEVLS
ncbi:amidase [Rhodococcus rhodochrous]|nr:amidase [Rhodococcus rhodochrous]